MTLRITPAEIVAAAESSGRPGLLVKAPSWGRVLLGEVARVVNGAPYDSSRFNVDQRGMPLVRIRDVGARRISTWYDGGWDELQRVRRGDLLIGMDGNFTIDQWHLGDAVLNQRVCRLDVDEDRMDRRFLELALQGYLDAIWSRTSSTTVKHLSSKTIAQIPLPAAPIDEQCRIVEILEEHLSNLDAGRAALQDAKRRRDAYVRSFLHAEVASSDGANHPLAELVQMGSGGTPRAGTDRYYRDGAIPWAVIGDLSDGPLTVTASRITDQALRESSAKLVPPGAVLVAMYGSIGKLAITRTPLATNQAIAFLVPGPRVRSDFLFWWLRGQREKLVEAGRGGTQKNISQTILRTWPIPVPSLDDQERIARSVEDAQRAATRLDGRIEELQRRELALRRALLQAAFSGQLTGRASDLDRVEELVS